MSRYLVQRTGTVEIGCIATEAVGHSMRRPLFDEFDDFALPDVSPSIRNDTLLCAIIEKLKEKYPGEEQAVLHVFLEALEADRRGTSLVKLSHC